MRNLIFFYFKPSKYNSITDTYYFFRLSLLLYFLIIFIYSTLSFIVLNKELISTAPVSNNLTFYLLRTISLLLKQPIQVLFLTGGIYLFFGIFNKNRITFMELYKFVFISFNIIILSYFVDIINVFAKYFNIYQILNIFKYSLNDIFIKNTDCTNLSTSLLERINPLLILSIVYLFFFMKNKKQDVSNIKLSVLIISSVLITLLLFSAIPQLFLTAINLINRK